jgi:hypothetical protein
MVQWQVCTIHAHPRTSGHSNQANCCCSGEAQSLHCLQCVPRLLLHAARLPHAEYLTLPSRNLHIVPEHLTDREACFSEPLAAACRILEQGVVRPGQKVAVIGRRQHPTPGRMIMCPSLLTRLAIASL